MVTLQDNNRDHCLVLRPNRSADWRANKRLLLAVLMVSAIISTGFAMIGAWVILPFAGLEILTLTAALYWVNWQLNYRQVLWFEAPYLRIEKGYYRPRESWRWLLQETAIQVNERERQGEPLSISLSRGATTVRIGEFLNADDSRALLEALRSQGLPTASYSRDGALRV